MSCAYADAAFASCCGHRPSMEDHHVFSRADIGDLPVYFAGVFDGHGGADCSRDSAKLLPEMFFDKLKTFSSDIPDSPHPAKLANLVRACVYETDKACQRYTNQGTCAVFAIVWGNMLLNNYCWAMLGNLGDSRALKVSKENCQVSVSQITHDHKPEDEKEKKRIELAGGFVSQYPFDCPRTCGRLSLSRALGDFRFKNNVKLHADRQVISSCADLFFQKVTPGESLCLACDGVFEPNSMSVQKVGGLIQAGRGDATTTAKTVVQTSMDEGSRDNNTCLVMHF